MRHPSWSRDEEGVSLLCKNIREIPLVSFCMKEPKCALLPIIAADTLL
jgi:hypothetical protein